MNENHFQHTETTERKRESGERGNLKQVNETKLWRCACIQRSTFNIHKWIYSIWAAAKYGNDGWQAISSFVRLHFGSMSEELMGWTATTPETNRNDVWRRASVVNRRKETPKSPTRVNYRFLHLHKWDLLLTTQMEQAIETIAAKNKPQLNAICV